MRLWLTAPDSGEQYKHMSQNEKIIKQINEELENQKLEKLKQEVKAYKLEQLNLQEKLKEEKEKIEEKLRIVKLNLENLDNGKFDAIEERIKKSETAKQLSNFFFPTNTIWNPSWTTGTYTIRTSGGINKTFYF